VADHQNRGRPPFPNNKVPMGAAQVGCDFCSAETAVSVSLNGQLSVLQLVADAVQTVTGHSAPIADLCCGSASFFYTCDSEGVLVQWDVKSGQPIRRIVSNEDVDLFHKVHKGAAVAVAVLQQGHVLFSVGYDDQLRMTKDNVVQETSTPLGAQPVAMASGTDRAVVATVQSLLLVDANGTVLDTKTLPYEALCVTVTANDAKAYVGGKDNIIHVYDISGGSLSESSTSITGHRKPVHSLALSKDGTKLASGDDKDICVWDLISNNYEALVGPGKWCFHTQRVTKLAWSPDGRILASAGADDATFLWTLESKMKRIHYKFCHRGGITGLHFLADRQLVSAGADAAVQVWNVAGDVTAKFG
jgi:WD repeat-containing protein 1 (actin-interacting protein 1)